MNEITIHEWCMKHDKLYRDTFNKNSEFKINDYIVFKNIPFKEGIVIEVNGVDCLIQEIKRDENGNEKNSYKKEWFHESELLLM